jgi:hypothetical protein
MIKAYSYTSWVLTCINRVGGYLIVIVLPYLIADTILLCKPSDREN